MKLLPTKASVIEYIEENYTKLDTLAFCRAFEYDFLHKAVTDFQDAIKEIADRTLKSNNANKELIKWAKALRKSNINLFTSPLIYSHFYSLRRRNLLQAKKLLRIQEEVGFIKDQLEDIESNQEEEEIYPTQVTRETSQEANQYIQNEITGGDPLFQNPNEYVNINMLQDLKSSFEQNFNAMKKEDKWYLSSGKCVEDELYVFGMQCVEEHPSHSFIIDVSDKNLVKYNVFNDNELKEIESFNKKEVHRMPLALRDYLNSFNKTTATDIRREIFKSQDFDKNYSHELSSDFDWIRHSIYTLLRLYESDKLKKAHRESWYLSHVWQFIDSAFDNIKNIDVLSQECSSVSSSKRKNKDRSIGGVEMRERKKVGYRCDMIFCENRIGHDESIEYGASEAGKLYDGDEGTKRLEEGSKKLPKCLKDMLDHLLLKKDDRSKIQTIGFVHSGLESFFMTADRPVKYATRIIKSRRTHISNDISGFGSTILPALYSAWMAKEVVKSVQDVLYASVECDNVENSSWLDDYWDEERNEAIIPKTSTSSDLRAVKKIKRT
ncbi:hypothetical protein G6F61_004902 [Rhizopus arrhizus]|nr:hypothetical protein G6F61_004902 [Rhizopus arrhizus]